ncbi:cell wall-binding repeat-containing protein, partial [Halorussus marinus]
MDIWKLVAMGVAAIVAILVATQPVFVVGLTLFDYGQAPSESYTTMQTKDVSRFPVNDPQRQSELTARAARPPDSGLNYSTVVRVPENDWQTAMAASRLRASEDALLLFGNATPPSSANGTNTSSVSTVDISGGNPAETAASIATRGNGSDDISQNNVIIVNSDEPQWALPAAAWSAYSGDPILYANEDGVPDATQEAIEELNASHAYVLAPPGLVSDEALSDLNVEWTRVSGDTPQDHAIEVAEFRDESRDFGWGIHERDKVGYYNFMLVNPSEPEHAVSSTNLQWGKAGPILLVNDDGSLPAVTENYAWQSQPAWFSTPAEGPFNHLFAMGSTDQVSWVSQGRLDYAVEITQYRHQGAGLSPLESLAAIWAGFSILGASFVFAHARHRLPEMNDWTTMVWPLLTLVLGPFGLALYWLSYRGRQIVTTDQGPR